MNIFISWSKEKSKQVALLLKPFLQGVNPKIFAWVSDTDIGAGEQWSDTLKKVLDQSDFGIICVTQATLESQWIMYEAGYLNSTAAFGVCPYLIDIKKPQLYGPLALAQSKEATQKETWELLYSINFDMAAGDRLSEETLRQKYDALWPDYEAALREINRNYKDLPEGIRQKMMAVIPRRLSYDELRQAMFGVNLPDWSINWNQAPINTLQQLIQLATDEKKVSLMMQEIYQINPQNDLAEILQSVSAWEATFY